MIKPKAEINKLNKFLSDGIWKSDLSQQGTVKRSAYQSLKVGLLSFKHFKEDKLQLRASALTFFSLLSIVPVLAMAFGLAKGFGLDKQLEVQILERFSGQEEVLGKSMEFARVLLDSTKGGLVAGIGLIFLFYSVMKLLNHIEASFNDIWYVHKHRTLTRKLTDYLAIILLGPILMIVANSLTVFIAGEIAKLTETVQLIGLFKGLIFPLLRLLPYIVVWILFTLIYMIMPNTTVKFKPAFIAGILAGSAFQLVQWGLIYFAVNVSQYNAIYGSFAALPLFLVWLQTSWLIVLMGSEISYAIQNASKHDEGNEKQQYSITSKRSVVLAICLLIIRNFKDGKPPMTIEQVKHELDVPDRLLREIIQELLVSRILSETRNEDELAAYQPAQDTDRLDVATILSAFEHSGQDLETSGENDYLNLATKTVHKMDALLESSNVNSLLKEV